MNALRVSLHPEGMAPRIANLSEWRAHLLERLERQIALTGEPRLRELAEEAEGYPAPEGVDAAADAAEAGDRRGAAAAQPPPASSSFFSTVATFGTAVEITTSELAIESFFPADAETATGAAGTTSEVIDTPTSVWDGEGTSGNAPPKGSEMNAETAVTPSVRARVAALPGEAFLRSGAEARRSGQRRQRPRLRRGPGALDGAAGRRRRRLRAIGAFFLVYAATIWAISSRAQITAPRSGS